MSGGALEEQSGLGLLCGGGGAGGGTEGRGEGFVHVCGGILRWRRDGGVRRGDLWSVYDRHGADDQCVSGHRVLGQLGVGWVVQVYRFSCKTSQQHLLEKVVYLGQATELNELQLFDHLPRDAL